MLRAVRELHREFAVLDGSKFKYSFGLHNSRAVYAKKLCRVEPLFERSHRLAYQERTTVDVEFNIVTSSPNPLNILRDDDLNAGSSLHRKPGRESICGSVQHFHDPLCHVGLQCGVDQITSSTHRCREACVVHRFQQVMQRMNIECPQNMLLIRCQKNECGQAISRQRPQHLKTVHSGHLDVEEHHIGRSFQNSFHCGMPICAFPNNLDIPEFA